MSSPFIINKSRFVFSQSKKFESYIEYLDREEVKRDKGYNHYSLYNEYMSNEMKSSELFSAEKSNLTEDEKEKMKELFTIAKNNNSVLWQDVFSFNNKKLKEQGFYNSKTKALDEEAIREATCNAMNYLLEEDNLKKVPYGLLQFIIILIIYMYMLQCVSHIQPKKEVNVNLKH